MPTKHTRKKGEGKDTADLPPSQIARPLSTQKSAASNGIFTTDIAAPRKSIPKRRRVNPDKIDDTPKAFLRLMAMSQGKKLPRSLDDGIRPTKKQKKAENAGKVGNGESVAKKIEVVEQKPEMPTIRPGEKMSEFSARVDAALPISGLLNKTGRGGKDPLGLKQYRTKKEKKMHKMYDEWREQEAKIQEKRQEALELAEEAMDPDNDDGLAKWRKTAPEDDPDLVVPVGGKKKKGKTGKKRLVGEIKEKDDDDPWAVIKRNRNEAPIGLNDVALAPPTLKAVKPKFKVRAGAMVEIGDVPKAAGSLRKREELGEERLNIIENYRKLMRQQREEQAAT